MNTVKLRASVQRFGSFLSGMIMPNIGAFIAWGLITALFIPSGIIPRYLPGLPLPNNQIAAMVGPMIFYLLPLLIAYTGGNLIHGARGGLAGAVGVMGVIVATSDKLFIGDQGAYPMFLGAMVVGPAAAWGMKKVDRLWEGRIRPGFEMLVNNFSLGIYAALAAIASMFLLTPVMNAFTAAAGEAVGFLIRQQLLPLTAVLIEPAKVLFLNNAINHGLLTPIGTEQAISQGSSILLLLETNPGPGLGILLAYMLFGRGAARATAPGAALIHFFGGIHEVYFPYVLMRPILIVAAILGGMSGIFVETWLGVGLRSPAAPGSIFAIWATVADGNILGVSIGVLTAALVSFVSAAAILYFSSSKTDLSEAAAKTQTLKGKSSALLDSLAKQSRKISRVVFACDAGMGSSAMGASLLREKLKAAGWQSIQVTNRAIADLDDTYDLVVVHEDLLVRAKAKTPGALHMTVSNFMDSPVYRQIVEYVAKNNDAEARLQSGKAAEGSAPDAKPQQSAAASEVLVRLQGKAASQEEAIKEAGAMLVESGAIADEYITSMLERESVVSTYMGNLLAIPHGTKDGKAHVLRTALAVVRYQEPLEWAAQKPVKFVIAIAAKGNEHLQTLSKIAKIFSDPQRVQALEKAESAAEVIEILEG